METLPELPKMISVIDGNHFTARAFFALRLSDSKGRNTSAIYGVIDMLNNFIEEFPCDGIVFVWDEGGSENRKAILPTYKESRIPKDEEEKARKLDWINQMKVCKQILHTLGVPQVGIYGYEGDDMMCALSRIFKTHNIITQIVTSDKDMLQLVDKMVCWTDPLKKKSINEFNFEEELKMKRERFLLYKCLQGDKGDDVPGIPKIGEGRALSLVQKYATIDEIVNNSDVDIAGRTARGQREILERNVKLLDVNQFISEEILQKTRELLKVSLSIDMKKFEEFCKEYEMYSLLGGIERIKTTYQNLKAKNESILKNI